MITPSKTSTTDTIVNTAANTTVQSVSTGVNNLFRFLTVTEPAVDLVKKNSGTVISPPVVNPTGGGVNPTTPSGPLPLTTGSTPKGAFFAAVGSEEEPGKVQAAVAGVMKRFKPFAGYADALNINPQLAELGNWMEKYSINTPLKELVAQKAKVKGLKESEEVLLWDNLYYFTLSGSSPKTADAIILMIRANAFLSELETLNLKTEIAEEPAQKLANLANAFITIPAQLVRKPKVDTLTGAPFVDVQTRKGLLRYSNLDIAAHNIKRLSGYIAELKAANEVYRRQESLASQKAGMAYLQQIEGMLNDEIKDIGDEGKTVEKLSNLRNSSTDKTPSLQYTTTSPFDDKFVNRNLSAKSARALRRYRKDVDESIQDVVATIEAELGRQYTVLIDNYDRQPASVNFYGTNISINNQPANNTYVVRSECVDSAESLYTIFITGYFDNPNAAFRKITIKVQGKEDGKTFTATSRQPVRSNQNYATFQFFEEGIPLDEYKLEVDYNTVSDNTGSFGQPQFLMSGALYGKTFPNLNPPTPSNDGIPGNENVTMYGVSKIGVGDFMRVEQEICCYVAGEVSHIENIMAREYKEKATRELNRVETTTEETSEREEERLKDTVTTERHELNSEIARVLQQDKSMQAGANAQVDAKYGDTVKVSAGGNFNSTNSSSLNNSFKEAESYAKDVVTRAMERVVEKITYKRTSRILREFEETNKHGFDNRLGTEHVTGIYRWVDKIYANRVMNYGKRLMYNFVVPEPAKNFKKWMTEDNGNSTSNLGPAPVPPIHPSALGIDDDSKLNRSNYADIAGEYGVEIEPCPPANIDISLSAGESIMDSGDMIATAHNNRGQKWKTAGYKYETEIPDNYCCTGAYVGASIQRDNTETEQENICVIAGNRKWLHGHTDSWQLPWDHNFLWHPVYQSFDNQETGPQYTLLTKKLTVSVVVFGVSSFQVNVMGKCTLLPEIYPSWQSAAYMKIMAAYFRKVQEYNDKLSEYNALAQIDKKANEQEDRPYSFNPLTARSIEQRELKRLCIELMLAPFGLFPYKYSTPALQGQYMSIGQNHYYEDAWGTEKILRDANLDTHAQYVKFMEEAFDWEIMAYILYPYYWGAEWDWSTLIKQNSPADPIFQSFLQSGMANVRIPVRQGYETAVLYFLDTGRLNKNKPLIPGTPNQDYVDIINAMQLPKATQIGDIWYTRVPTALTIIQKDSGGLDADGLPCSSEVFKDVSKYCCAKEGCDCKDKQGHEEEFCCEDGTPIATKGTAKNLLGNLESKDCTKGKIDEAITSIKR